MALKFCCGADCGIAVVGTASAGVEHWSTASAAASVATSGPVPMRSKRAFRMNPSAAACVLTHTFAAATGGTATARFYIYFSSLPTANVAIFLFTSAGGNRGIIFNQADSTLRCGSVAGTGAASGIAVTTGRWYMVEVSCNWNVSQRSADGRVDGVALTRYSSGTGASTSTAFSMGQSTAWTGDYYIDDVAVFDGEYPIGGGSVPALYPNRDGTHSFNTSGDFKKGASGGTNAASTDTDLWQSLQNPLSGTTPTNWIADAAGAAAEYVEFGFEPPPAPFYINGSTGGVDGVMLVVTTHSATTTANNFKIVLNDGTNSKTFYNLDLSETGITIPVVVQNLDMTDFFGLGFSGGAVVQNDPAQWKARFQSSDVSPIPNLDGICMEVSVRGVKPRPTIIRQAVQRRAVR